MATTSPLSSAPSRIWRAFVSEASLAQAESRTLSAGRASTLLRSRRLSPLRLILHPLQRFELSLLRLQLQPLLRCLLPLQCRFRQRHRLLFHQRQHLYFRHRLLCRQRQRPYRRHPRLCRLRRRLPLRNSRVLQVTRQLSARTVRSASAHTEAERARTTVEWRTGSIDRQVDRVICLVRTDVL